MRKYLLIFLPCFAIPAFAQKSHRALDVTFIDCTRRAAQPTASTPPE
jgi:hypothetical protein